MGTKMRTGVRMAESDDSVQRLLTAQDRKAASHQTDMPRNATTYSRSWLRRRLGQNKVSTATKYAGDLTRHILLALGDAFIDALRPRDIAAFVAEQAGP